MRRVLYAAAVVLLLAACEAHVRGPENMALTPEGEPVVVTVAGGETREGELVEVAGTSLILKERGRYVGVDLSTVQRVQVTRYSLSLDGSFSELPPYSRYPQGLTTEQRDRLLEESGQKDSSKLFEVELTSEKPQTADAKTEPGTVIESKDSQSSYPAGKEPGDNRQPTLFDTRTGMSWIIVSSGPVDLTTAKSICASLETGDKKKYRVPSLREFEELWNRYQNDERISIFKKREYITDSKNLFGTITYPQTFSFVSGNPGKPGQLNAAYLTCVRR